MYIDPTGLFAQKLYNDWKRGFEDLKYTKPVKAWKSGVEDLKYRGGGWEVFAHYSEGVLGTLGNQAESIGHAVFNPVGTVDSSIAYFMEDPLINNPISGTIIWGTDISGAFFSGDWNSFAYGMGGATVLGLEVYAGAGVANKVPNVSTKTNNIYSNKTFTNSTKKVNNYTSATTGYNAAKSDFYSLNPSNVRSYSNGTIVGILQDGRTINVHSGKSVGGAPTVEIYDPITGIRSKIRY